MSKSDRRAERRVAKNKRRERRRAADARCRERREMHLRQAVENREGLAKLNELDQFFRDERHRVRLSGKFGKVLNHIKDLRLLLIQEHRHTLSAGIKAVLDKYKEKEDVGIFSQAFPDMMETCDRICEVDLDKGIRKLYELDQFSMYWLVTGDIRYMEAVYDIASNEEHEWQLPAVEVMAKFEGAFEEVADFVQQRRASLHKSLSEEEEKDIEDVQALALELQNCADWHRIVFVKLEDGVIVIGTRNPGPIPEAPVAWREKPVLHRVASDVEVRRHEKWVAEMEDPI